MGSSQETVSVLGELRAKTRTLHEQIEKSIDLGAALVSTDAYSVFLTGYLGLYRPFEEQLSRQAVRVREAAGWPEGSRVKLLEADLQSLGMSLQEIQAVPDCVEFPVLEERDAMMGALYVIEGSQLGGQYIYRQVKEKLALDKESGAAFFYGSGEGTGSEWKQFLECLEALVEDPQLATDAAVAMFHAFEIWLGNVTATLVR